MPPETSRLAAFSLRFLLPILATVPAGAGAAFDYEWTFNNNGFADYTLTSVSSPDLYPDALPADDPTINLISGKRHRITVVNPGPHPVDILAKGSSASGDVILLAQGANRSGSFESDPAVDWQEPTNKIVEFTVTPALVEAMNAPERR